MGGRLLGLDMFVSDSSTRPGRSTQTLYPQVPAQETRAHVYVFDLDLHVVDLSIGLLRPAELAAMAQVRGAVGGE